MEPEDTSHDGERKVARDEELVEGAARLAAAWSETTRSVVFA